MKLFLIGMPGSGKSTVGESLSANLNMPFFDLDKVIEQEEGMTVREIFNTKGESHFRTLERHFMQDLTQNNQSFVLATGGGVPCFFDNIDYMKHHGKVVFLNIPITVLALRLQKEGLAVRPLLKDFSSSQLLEKHLNNTYDKRKKFYEQADIYIDADLPAEALIKAITAAIEATS